MKLTVFGASGQTGRQVVEQALASGHDVTAVVRDVTRLDIRHERLHVVAADVFDAESISPAVSGRDAVVSALGAPSRAPTTVCETGVRAISKAMHANGVPRLVVVSNSAHTAERGDSPVRRVFQAILGKVLKNPFADLRQMERVIRDGDLDWTIMRPARMTNGPQTGIYRTEFDGHVPAGWRIARADVADLVLRLLEDDDSIGRLVGLAY